MNNQNNKGMDEKQIADKAREHAIAATQGYGPGSILTFAGFKLRAKNSYQNGFNDAIQWANQQSDDRNEFLQTENEKDQREIVQLRHDNEGCERRIVELEMLLKQQSDGDRLKLIDEIETLKSRYQSEIEQHALVIDAFERYRDAYPPTK